MPSFKVIGKIFEWAIKHIVALYLSLIVFTNFALMLDYKYDSGNAPLYDIAILLLFVPLLLLDRQKVISFMKTDFMKWFLFFAFMYTLNLLRMRYGGYAYTDVEMIEEVNRVQRLILWPVIGFCVYVVDARFFRFGLFAALILMPALIIVDFINPEILGAPDELMDARAQGTYLNANLATEAVILLGLLNLNRFKGLLGVFLVLLMGIGILVTFSRSGLVALVLFGAYLFFSSRLPKTFILAPVLLVVFYSTLLVYAEDVLLLLGYDASVANVLSRLNFFGEVDMSDIGATDTSAEARAFIAGEVLKQSIATPVSGHVFSAASEYGLDPHNQPLHLWYKYGLLGLLAWIGMLFVLWRRGMKTGLWWFSPALLVFAWFSFFTHNIIESKFWIIFFAFVLLQPRQAWHGSTVKFRSIGSMFRDWQANKSLARATSASQPKRKKRRTKYRF